MPTGWIGSNRNAELPADWPERRRRTLVRDNYRCQHIRFDTGRKCLRAARDVDHIKSHKAGGTDDDDNLESLCGWHHDQKSGREGGLASGKARRAKNAGGAKKHPGVL